FFVHGYEENGWTTTPFDMQVRNHTSRYHLAIETLETMAAQNVIPQAKAQKIIETYKKALADHYHYITTYGADPKDIENWEWHREEPQVTDEIFHANVFKN